MVELVLGGARSGKSAYAEAQALSSGLERFYIATATVYDDEMQQRVDRHIEQRESRWQTIEEPLLLAETLTEHARDDRSILVDCLTLWLSNHLAQKENNWQRQKQALLEVLPNLPGQILLVSNEVGLGIVPMGELSRRFVDEAGWLHQAIGQLADKVTFVAAGLPLTMKSEHISVNDNKTKGM